MIKYIILIIILNSILLIRLFTDQDVPVQIKAIPRTEAGNTIDVILELHKAGVTGFARFQQKLPYGITASPVYPADMNFSFEENTVKMIWLNLPPEETIIVHYQIHINERLKGELELGGTFSYIINNQRRITQAKGTMLSISPSPTIEEQLIVDVREAGQKLIASIPREKFSVVPFPETFFRPVPAPLKEERRSFRPGIEISKPLQTESGVYYRVQLAAGRRPVDIEPYFGKLNVSFDVRSELHEGWIKYSIGSYYDYRSARDYRVNIRKMTPIDDAFVTAYNNGVRITVQEALVIANHQWYR